jgi:hypothetical protein
MLYHTSRRGGSKEKRVSGNLLMIRDSPSKILSFWVNQETKKEDFPFLVFALFLDCGDKGICLTC